MSENLIIQSETRGARVIVPVSGLQLFDLFARHSLLALSLAQSAIWIAFSLWHSIPFASFETDGMEYIETAKSILTPGFTYSSYHALGYPVLIWLTHFVVPDWFLAARIVSGAAGLVFLVGVYLLVENIANRRAAVAASVLVITNFFVIAYSGMAMADMVGAALGFLAPVILIRSQSANRYGWAGLAAGLAAATRYQFLALGMGVVVLLLETGRRARLRAGLLYLMAFAAAVLPLFIINWLTFGNPLFNSNYTLVGLRLSTSPAGVTASSWNQVTNSILANPSFVLFHYFKSVAFDVPLFLIHVVYYSVFFALPGWLLTLTGRKEWVRFGVLAGFMLAYVLVTSISWVFTERYWLYLVPFFSAGAALLLARNSSRAGWVVLVVLVAVNIAGVVDNFGRLADQQAPEFKRAGDAIRAESAPGDRLLASQPQIGYLADRKSVLWRDAPDTWDALAVVVARGDIRYVVMDDRYGSGHYPELARLFDPSQVSARFPDWQMIYSESKGARIIVYRTGRP